MSLVKVYLIVFFFFLMHCGKNKFPLLNIIEIYLLKLKKIKWYYEEHTYDHLELII